MFARHTFGGEGAAYVRSYLESNEGFGGRFGPLLLAGQAIEAGRTWGFVPAGSSAKQRKWLEAGGLFPPRRAGEEPARSQRAEARAWLSGLLATASPSCRVLCLEEAVMRRSPQLDDALREVNFFFCGNGVYWFATPEDLEGLPMEWVPLGGALGSPHVAIATELPTGSEPLANRQSISSEMLKSMVAATAVVVVGGWDDEGLLFWEPEPKASRAPRVTPVALPQDGR